MESNLRQLIYTDLTEFAEGLDEPLWIVWDNYPPALDSAEAAPYNPLGDAPDGRGYLKVSLMPFDGSVLTSCGTGAVHNWILQVSVFVRDGTGEFKVAATLDRLRAYFPATHEFADDDFKFKIISVGNATPPVPTDGWFFIPLQWRILTIR